MTTKIKLCLLFLICLLVGLIVVNSRKPSNNRDWSVDQKIVAYADINSNIVSIHNIRNFKYKTVSEYNPNYYDKSFDINKLKNLYFIIEPFTDYIRAAHTFLSFEFEDDNFLAISVEIRKKKGDNFSAFKGLINEYELMYVIADERDVVKLRTNFRKDNVYVLPIDAKKEQIQKLFLAMINRANKLKSKPEFYNTISNNCTSNIMKNVNIISTKKIKYSYKILFPAYAGELAYDLGLIKTDLSDYKAVKQKFLINEKAMKFADDVNFSRRIRE